MDRLLLVICIIFTPILNISGISDRNIKQPFVCSMTEEQDTIPDKQLLFNGRIWRSLYSRVVGNEFLLSNDWLNGEVIINDARFNDVLLRFDIYNDQLLIMMNQGTFVQLNKELITGFNLKFENKRYTFENFGDSPGICFKGFAQVLVKGKICFVIKQTKQIKQLAVQNKYDEFYQKEALFILKDSNCFRITGKKDLVKILSDKNEQIHKFLSENKIRMKKRNPESFIPLIQFYNNLE